MTPHATLLALDHMRSEELAVVLGWAAEEGWNPGLDDAPAFFAADPKGFFVARHSGQIVAAISVVNHAPDFAFLGLYICRPERRGHGIGLALWNHALTHAGERTIGLDGVPDQQGNYAASGFVKSGETSRFTGGITAGPMLAEASPKDIPWITALEAAACGYDKPDFMKTWIAPSLSRRTVVLPQEQGFATIRACKSGAKIGPLVAQDLSGAQKLLHAAAGVFTGPVSIDLPRDARALTDYCQSLGMTCGFSTARMYRGPAPMPGLPIRAVATLELG